jgi:hypothetical protein
MASVRFIEVQARPTEFLDLVVFQSARSQGSNPWQTQVMALGVSRSSSIFLWTWSHISAIKRPSV